MRIAFITRTNALWATSSAWWAFAGLRAWRAVALACSMWRSYKMASAPTEPSLAAASKVVSELAESLSRCEGWSGAGTKVRRMVGLATLQT